MQIRSVAITNYRSLEHVEIEFSEVTTFIGPNGSGKSSILRALDWFFNGQKGGMSEDDRFAGAAPDASVVVEVVFDGLTLEDRLALGDKYAPEGVETLTVTRSWADGTEKITGKALALPEFEKVRAAQGAMAKKAALAEAQESRKDLELPRWTRLDAIEGQMSEFERQHPNELRDARVSDTHFFGFNSEGKLSGLFDFVFVAADLRASEESQDSRTSIIGRVLEKAVDRKAADEAMADLVSAFIENQGGIYEKHLAQQLESLSTELTDELNAFTNGRAVRLQPVPPELKPQQVRVGVSIVDSGVETQVAHQGHGFQRALLVSALKLLATKRRAGGSGNGVMCLAIEEPELFQHPTQARAFAAVLRELAMRPLADTQIVYATHSPYFIEPRYFDQIRRVSRVAVPDGFPKVAIAQASIASTILTVGAYVNERAILSRWDQVCLKSLPEALFADAVILVEGDDDKAILEGASISSGGNLAAKGIAVAAAYGKGTMLLPYSILEQLGIQTLLIFDSDSGCEARMRRDGKGELDIEGARLSTIDQNHKILRYFDQPEEDWPRGILSANLVAIPDMIETMLNVDWPEWDGKREQIVSEGRGTRGKNAATYALAARECEQPPAGDLASILEMVLAL